MSNYSECDFCTVDDGLDYTFTVLGAIYGASLSRHFEGMDLAIVRKVWADQIGRFLTYKPSIDYAISRLSGDFPPSAIKFREFCNAGPEIPVKPTKLIQRQPTEQERLATEKAKADALSKLATLRSKK